MQAAFVQQRFVDVLGVGAEGAGFVFGQVVVGVTEVLGKSVETAEEIHRYECSFALDQLAVVPPALIEGVIFGVPS